MGRDGERFTLRRRLQDALHHRDRLTLVVELIEDRTEALVVAEEVTLVQLLTASGFRDVAVDFRSPVPESESLPPGLADDPRFAPLARLLFAPQDYAVTGVK